jgi:hypothetical protein
MDDLSGLDWTSSNSQNKRPPPPTSSSAFAALRPTPPVSGRSTPLNGSPSNPPSKPGTPANDTFSNLVNFNSSAPGKNLSLLEQQKRLLQQRAEQETVQRKQLNEQYKGNDEHFWNNLGSGRSTPAPVSQPQGPVTATGVSDNVKEEEDDDFLAFFTSTDPVRSTAHSTDTKTQRNGDATNSLQALSQSSGSLLSFEEQGYSFADDEDDDPFGLSHSRPARTTQVQASSSQLDDDDVLGLLAKPVSEIPKPPKKPEQGKEPTAETKVDPRDRAMAELVDMGFPADKARQALETADSGTDVSAAVSWLLQQAHAETRQQVEAQRKSSSSRHREERRGGGSPVDEYVRSQDSRQQRREGTSGPSGEKDPAQLAAELGNNFLKTAGSLWKTGTKRVQQAVQEFNSDSDSSQPRWMREGSSGQVPTTGRTQGEGHTRRRRKSSGSKAADLVTDEVRMLESDHGRPPPRKPMRSRTERRLDSSPDNSRDHSPVIPSRLRDEVPPNPAFLRQQQPAPTVSRASLSRQAIEEQASQAYVSSARRRKPPSQPSISTPKPDLLEAASQESQPSKASTSGPGRVSKPSTPLPVRPAPPLREIPPISSIALNASNSQREAGNAHYKRGDYSAAHQSYATAISHLPKTHPIVIVLLVNHALTSLKIGEPRTAISDADSAMTIVGPSKGESETVDFMNGERPKPMREFYGKALMRKAEALEQIEKWPEAAVVWKEAVEGGHGGATSIQGRIRAERAATPQTNIPKAPPPKKPSSVTGRAAMGGLPGSRTVVASVNSEAAVNRLRAANAAAEKADEEKFALTDSVETRVAAWKGGKADNLRALLSSLELVLWPEAEWKKIGMAELVLPNKVKIQYMKGIAKVHPDKVSGIDLPMVRASTDCDCLLDTDHCNDRAKDDCWRSLQYVK